MKKIIIAVMVILLSACTLGAAVTPRQKVSEFLEDYSQTHNLEKNIERVKLAKTLRKVYENKTKR